MTGLRFVESLHAGYGQGFDVSSTLYHEKTDFQELFIFETPALGRVLVLDGVVQTTERDEFYYHEMMTHLPIIGHGAVERVLIIGGGDGGALREVLRHDTVAHATMVEIDPKVVELSREYLPGLSAGAFDDPRAEVIYADGTRFVAETADTFDVVIVDSTDPIGPAVALFEDPFYRDCRRILGERGILVRQAGVPFFQREEYVTAYRRLGTAFKDRAFALVAVPTYCGGAMALAWASDEPTHRHQDGQVLAERWAAAGIETRYYSPDVHAGAFALPAFMTRALAG